jgi:hypothetical protein
MMGKQVEVMAASRWNDTGLDIRKGQSVRITASGNWIDGGITATPDGFDKPWLNPVRWSRRKPSAPWFCLCATIGQMKRPIHAVGTSGQFTAGRDGRLWLFANDAWLFYFNNKGTIRATIALVED